MGACVCVYFQIIGRVGETEPLRLPEDDHVHGVCFTLDEDEDHVLAVSCNDPSTNTGYIAVFDADSGIKNYTCTSPAGTLQSPWAIATVESTGQVLVTDTGRHQVIVFEKLEVELTVAGILGSGRGSMFDQFESPQGLAILGKAANGILEALVSDFYNHRICVYDLGTFTYLRTIGSAGKAPGQFSFPAGIDVIPARLAKRDDDLIVVGDSMNYRIQILTRDGHVVQILAMTPGRAIRLPVISHSVNEIVVLDSTGTNRRVLTWQIDFGNSSPPRVVYERNEEQGRLCAMTIDPFGTLKVIQKIPNKVRPYQLYMLD